MSKVKKTAFSHPHPLRYSIYGNALTVKRFTL